MVDDHHGLEEYTTTARRSIPPAKYRDNITTLPDYKTTPYNMYNI